MNRSLLLLALVLLGGVPSARALDVDTFQPSGSSWDGRGVLQLAHPEISYPGAFYGGFGMAWSDDPLVRQLPDGTVEPVVDGLVATRFAAGATVPGARFDVVMPLYPRAGAVGATGFAPGDLRLGAVVPIWRQPGGTLGIALTPALRLPTGDTERYVGSQGTGVDLGAAVAGTVRTLRWTGNLGTSLGSQEALGDLAFGSNLAAGGGLALPVVAGVVVGTEVTGRLDLAGGSGGYRENPWEGHLYGQYTTPEGLTLQAGAGTGLVAGVGAPAARFLFGVSWHSAGRPPIHDQDGDGLLDDEDRCPEAAEDMDRFEDEDGCPDADNDGDGIVDDRDECPRQPEDIDGWRDGDGCPDPDNDSDLVLDAEDECPTEPGTVATRGCPDQDRDSVLDSVDMCVDVPGPAATLGCPDQDRDGVPDRGDACPDAPGSIATAGCP